MSLSATSRVLAIALLLAPAVVAPLDAQAPRPRDVAPRGGVQLAVGWDDVLVADVRVSDGVAARNAGWSRPRLSVGLTAPLVLLRTGDAWKLSVGVERGRLSARRARGALVRSRATMARAVDATGHRLAVGLELGAAPGLHHTRSTTTLDLEWRLTLATHVRPSPMVRALFEERGGASPADEGPSEGWHAGGASQLRLGVGHARLVGDGTLLLARGGVTIAPNRLGITANPMLGQLPFYLLTGVEALAR
ncbi:MAG TPA: hypothetical protein VEA99_15395 [Gemmatimonadaceae bacterium]|nr:hypothetical protein [Gemmatimonadaceae bacterium]